MSQSAAYHRIVLKLSGEVLAGSAGYGIDSTMLEYLASEVRAAHQLGIQIGIVIGGGNIFRGIQGAARGIERATGDAMGMLATVMNSLALRDALEDQGVPACIQTAVEMHQIAEPCVRKKALQ
jgi:uridylate kinase